MQISRRSAILIVSGVLPYLADSRIARAESVVKIALWDKDPASMDNIETMAPMGMAMSGAGMGMATMGITVDVAEFPAGEVTFNVTNESPEFYHAVTISPVTDPSMELPYLSDKMMVDEEAAGVTARVKELRPGTSRSMTVALQPGTYILYCNIAGHYAMGMWTLVKVTG
jgi:uncharacterized cupredoxin-like copper-binding protein